MAGFLGMEKSGRKLLNQRKMENPQTKNGYISIANELVEAFAKNFPGFTEGQIIWFILRKTYGWHKKEDKISISQIVSATKKSKRMVIYALLNLEAKKMIKIKRHILKGEKQPNIIKFNKHYSEWVVQEKTQQYKNTLEKRKKLYKKGSARNQRVVQETRKSLPFLAHTKETITKERERGRHHHKFTYLLNIPLDDLPGLSKGLSVNENQIRSKGEDLYNYCLAHARKYRDYRALLRNSLKRDFPAELKYPVIPQ